jgi:hypothetical protein
LGRDVRQGKAHDLWVEASPDNAERVLRSLGEFGAPLGSLTGSDLAKPGSGFRMGSPPLRIKVLTEVSGVHFVSAWPRRCAWAIEGTTVPVVSRADLIADKRAAGRPQDLADVDALERQERRKNRS